MGNRSPSSAPQLLFGVVGLVLACSAASRRGSEPAPAPGFTSTSSPGPRPAADPPRVVTIEELLSGAGALVGERAVVRGRVTVCQGVCDAIKMICGLGPVIDRCEGVAVLSSPDEDETTRCSIDSNPSAPTNSILLDERDPRFKCRGDCDEWTCGGVKAGQVYEVTGRLQKSDDRARPVLRFLPEGIRLIEEPGGVSARFASSPHVTLGVPTDADPSDDILLDKRTFVLSYSPTKLNPNWVAWKLDRSHLGDVRRTNDFRIDGSVKRSVYHVRPADYSRSGFDRGHMCPSADRNATPEMNSTTFLMTNVVPQLHELNAGPWGKLEEYARERARADRDVHVAAGPLFDPNPRKLERGIAVPRATFKILVQLESGQTAGDVTASTEVIAVVMPNEAGVGRRRWREFVTSVDEIEKQTGYDFLARVPDEVERVIEARQRLDSQ